MSARTPSVTTYNAGATANIDLGYNIQVIYLTAPSIEVDLILPDLTTIGDGANVVFKRLDFESSSVLRIFGFGTQEIENVGPSVTISIDSNLALVSKETTWYIVSDESSGSFLSTQHLFVDSVVGDDGTAILNDPGKPWKTIVGAKDYYVANNLGVTGSYTIWVRSGLYSEGNFGATGINGTIRYHFEEGTVVSPIGDNPLMETDVDLQVTGWGTFQGTEERPTGLFNLTNSNVYFEALIISGGQSQVDPTYVFQATGGGLLDLKIKSRIEGQLIVVKDNFRPQINAVTSVIDQSKFTDGYINIVNLSYSYTNRLDGVINLVFNKIETINLGVNPDDVTSYDANLTGNLVTDINIIGIGNVTLNINRVIGNLNLNDPTVTGSIRLGSVGSIVGSITEGNLDLDLQVGVVNPERNQTSPVIDISQSVGATGGINLGLIVDKVYGTPNTESGSETIRFYGNGLNNDSKINFQATSIEVSEETAIGLHNDGARIIFNLDIKNLINEFNGGYGIRTLGTNIIDSDMNLGFINSNNCIDIETSGQLNINADKLLGSGLGLGFANSDPLDVVLNINEILGNGGIVVSNKSTGSLTLNGEIQKIIATDTGYYNEGNGELIENLTFGSIRADSGIKFNRTVSDTGVTAAGVTANWIINSITATNSGIYIDSLGISNEQFQSLSIFRIQANSIICSDFESLGILFTNTQNYTVTLDVNEIQASIGLQIGQAGEDGSINTGRINLNGEIKNIIGVGDSSIGYYNLGIGRLIENLIFGSIEAGTGIYFGRTISETGVTADGVTVNWIINSINFFSRGIRINNLENTGTFHIRANLINNLININSSIGILFTNTQEYTVTLDINEIRANIGLQIGEMFKFDPINTGRINLNGEIKKIMGASNNSIGYYNLGIGELIENLTFGSIEAENGINFNRTISITGVTAADVTVNWIINSITATNTGIYIDNLENTGTFNIQANSITNNDTGIDFSGSQIYIAKISVDIIESVKPIDITTVGSEINFFNISVNKLRASDIGLHLRNLNPIDVTLDIGEISGNVGFQVGYEMMGPINSGPLTLNGEIRKIVATNTGYFNIGIGRLTENLTFGSIEAGTGIYFSRTVSETGITAADVTANWIIDSIVSYNPQTAINIYNTENTGTFNIQANSLIETAPGGFVIFFDGSQDYIITLDINEIRGSNGIFNFGTGLRNFNGSINKIMGNASGFHSASTGLMTGTLNFGSIESGITGIYLDNDLNFTFQAGTILVPGGIGIEIQGFGTLNGSVNELRALNGYLNNSNGIIADTMTLGKVTANNAFQYTGGGTATSVWNFDWLQADDQVGVDIAGNINLDLRGNLINGFDYPILARGNAILILDINSMKNGGGGGGIIQISENATIKGRIGTIDTIQNGFLIDTTSQDNSLEFSSLQADFGLQHLNGRTSLFGNEMTLIGSTGIQILGGIVEAHIDKISGGDYAIDIANNSTGIANQHRFYTSQAEGAINSVICSDTVNEPNFLLSGAFVGRGGPALQFNGPTTTSSATASVQVIGSSVFQADIGDSIDAVNSTQITLLGNTFVNPAANGGIIPNNLTLTTLSQSYL